MNVRMRLIEGGYEEESHIFVENVRFRINSLTLLGEMRNEPGGKPVNRFYQRRPMQRRRQKIHAWRAFNQPHFPVSTVRPAG